MSGRTAEPCPQYTRRIEAMLPEQEGDLQIESESRMAVIAQRPETHRGNRTMSKVWMFLEGTQSCDMSWSWN